MEFKVLPDITSQSGFVYEVSRDGIVKYTSRTGISNILKTQRRGNREQVRVTGKLRTIYDLIRMAGWPPKAIWPTEEIDWEELSFSTPSGRRYRIFDTSEIQSMDEYGNVSTMTHTKNSNGYMGVCINREQQLVHQLMSSVERWFPKPIEFDTTWSIHHLDNNPENNHKHNLVWAPKDIQTLERRQLEQPMILSYPVVGTALDDVVLKDGYIVKKGETKWFENAGIAADMISGHQANISSCINRKRETHAGFVWKTPSGDNDLSGEVFISISRDTRSERFISFNGRLKYLFHHGYCMIKNSDDMLTNRSKREKDMYPMIYRDGKSVLFHRMVVEIFIGKIPDLLIVDHIDDVKAHSRLGNLQLLTNKENCMKRYLVSYVMSVASFVDKQYEKTYDTKISAIDYVRRNGYPHADIDELNRSLKTMSAENTPAMLYGRTWIPAHFESYVKK